MSSEGGGKRSRPDEPPAGGWLPEELTLQILTKLRTGASLTRFRCLSKSCCRLLSDPKIVAKYVAFSHDPQAKIMVARSSDDWLDRWLIKYSIHSYNTFRIVSSGTHLPSADNLHRIAACSGGIFCLARRYGPHGIILWNPTTSETKLVPSPPDDSDLPARDPYGYVRVHDPSSCIGLGFDPARNDYKVLLVRDATRCDIYSLRNDSWRRLDDDDDHANRRNLDKQIHRHPSAAMARAERCHWYRDTIRNFHLTSFDVGSEEFTELELEHPPRGRRKNPRPPSLHMGKDGSCLICVRCGEEERKGYMEVWAALDYAALGRKEIEWTRLYSFDGVAHYLTGIGRVFGVGRHAKVIARAADRDDKLCLVDVEKEYTTYSYLDGIRGGSTYFELLTYLPSTVSLNQFGGGKNRI